jgi:hypothetical protein|tara:strand:+ start:144 stop:305 length:162 start_codon:yes stop_codon:yes gene_type:complete
MKEMLNEYIAACESLIAQHMLIEDVSDRNKAVNAQRMMIADFKSMKKSLYIQD